MIRYDNRDTGRSTSTAWSGRTWSGCRLGGGIAQLVALDHPERVITLTAISTSRVDEGDPDLPGSTDEYNEHAAAWEELDWSDTAALADMQVREARALAGTRHPFDETAARELVGRDLERAIDPRRLANHGEIGGGAGPRRRLEELALPLLVIHGTADPLLPYPHGVALAEAVPGAELVTIEGGGHELHERDWDQILDAIVRHTAVPG